jgi:two-component system KDP operon response regulator KdpE
VLDPGLPDINGRDLLRMLRVVSHIPVVVATARSDETGIVAMLDAGADDSPVRHDVGGEQLNARVRVVLRRAGGAHAAGRPTILRVGELVVDRSSGTVMLAGQPGVVDSEGVRQATVDLSDSHQRGRPGAESDRRAIPKHDQQGR